MKKTLSFSLIAALALVLAGCDKPVEGKTPDESDERLKRETHVRVPVEADLPVRRDIASYFETTSRVMAEERVEVMAKGMGECVSLNVEEGDYVEEGDILAQLDTEELRAQIEQTRVNVEQTRFQMNKSQEQMEQGILSSFESENSGFAYKQAAATLKLQQIQLANQTIRAPISGVVTARNIQKGMMVSSGVPAFSIVDPGSYMLPITPPEKELRNLSVGQVAKVTVDSAPGEEFDATVRRISPDIDPASGTVNVILDFADEDKELLKDSAFARVRLVMDVREDTLAVAKDSVVEESGRHFLLVITREELEPEEDESADELEPALVANRVEVETGLEDSDFVEIVSGIGDETLIVTLGQHTLKPGSHVEITNMQDEILANIDLTPDEALALAEEQRFQIPRKQDRREKMIR